MLDINISSSSSDTLLTFYFLYMLKVHDTLGIFSIILFKGDNICDYLFALQHTKVLLKKVYSPHENMSI